MADRERREPGEAMNELQRLVGKKIKKESSEE